MNNDKIMRENTHKQEHIKKGHRCMRSAYGKMMNGTSLIMNTLRNRSFNTFNYFFMTTPKGKKLSTPKGKKLRFSFLQLIVSSLYRGADKSSAQPGRKQATATEGFDVLISYLLS